MRIADAVLVEGGAGEKDDIYLSDQEEEEMEDDQVSLASDLDSDDLDEIQERQKELQRKNAPAKKVSFAGGLQEEEEEDEKNELLVELEDKSEKRDRETSLWFGKDIFTELDLEADADIEIKQTQKLYSEKVSGEGKGKGKGKGKATPTDKEGEETKQDAGAASQVKDQQEGGESDSDSDGDTSSSEDESAIQDMKRKLGVKGEKRGLGEEQDFEVVPVESTSKKARILNPEGLALGSIIAASKKKRRDLVDQSFNRYAYNEEVDEVPEWFLDDEKKHHQQKIQVTKELVEEYKERWKELNARPIKKVAEAKARKKRRGCDVNFRDSYYWTALMCAAYAGHCQVVQYLLQQGAAWVGVVETQGRDAMDLAEEAGHTEVVRALQDFRAISEEQTANRRRSATVKRWCAVCQTEYSEDSVEQHERSTVHLFSQDSTPAPTYYCLPENNVGFRLMVREGWDPESGLGPAGKGRKFPVKTVLKRDQKGLGFQTDLKAKVTHFGARDTQAVERAPGGKAGRTERVATVSKKEERRREEREKDWERDLRTYMNL
ncbi:UNVERIFIED_CONTAM: hypothetical protein FKN15_033063 [Acipenser sinensis]